MFRVVSTVSAKIQSDTAGQHAQSNRCTMDICFDDFHGSNQLLAVSGIKEHVPHVQHVYRSGSQSANAQS